MSTTQVKSKVVNKRYHLQDDRQVLKWILNKLWNPLIKLIYNGLKCRFLLDTATDFTLHNIGQFLEKLRNYQSCKISSPCGWLFS
jgi:hypothetical protein